MFWQARREKLFLNRKIIQAAFLQAKKRLHLNLLINISHCDFHKPISTLPFAFTFYALSLQHQNSAIPVLTAWKIDCQQPQGHRECAATASMATELICPEQELGWASSPHSCPGSQKAQLSPCWQPVATLGVFLNALNAKLAVMATSDKTASVRMEMPQGEGPWMECTRITENPEL